MVIVKIVLVLVVIYLMFGAWTGLIISDSIEIMARELKEERKTDAYISRVKRRAYLFCILTGPVTYTISFLGAIKKR